MDSKFTIAKNYYQRGQLEETKNICLEIIKTQPNHLESLRLLSLVFFVNKNYSKSANYIKKAISIEPNQASTHSDYGAVLQKLNKPEAAIKSYNKAIEINPNYAEAYNNLGNVLEELNKINLAIENYNKAIKINPNYAGAYNNLGGALAKLRKLKEAIKNYDIAIKIDQKLFGAYYNRGIALEDLHQLEEAVESYNMAVKINPNYVEAYNNQGNVLTKLKRREEALKSYDKALKINPNLDFLEGSLFFAKNILCDWEHYEKNVKSIKDKIFKNKKISSPFIILSIYDSPELQKISSEVWIKEKFLGKKL